MTPDLGYEEGGSWSKKSEDNKWEGQKTNKKKRDGLPCMIYSVVNFELLKRSISQVRARPKGFFLVQYIDAESCYVVGVVVVVVVV